MPFGDQSKLVNRATQQDELKVHDSVLNKFGRKYHARFEAQSFRFNMEDQPTIEYLSPAYGSTLWA